ncbi:MAG: UDP-N-acetylmuramoyl-L-alanine--D-glutamate ligase [Verrucomicrobiia bacterium]
MNVSGKQIVVLGLGESGRAAAELLLNQGATVVIRDSQLNERIRQLAQRLGTRGARIELGETSFSPCRFDLGILSPGIDPSRPLVAQLRQQQVPLLGELELAFRFCQAPVVAITGTNGKSTTTELAAALLKAGGKRAVACGNLGPPFSDIATQSADLDVAVVETSSFQLETIDTFAPRVAVHLNLTPDHLDRYPNMAAYAAAKLRIFENQTPSDFAIVNAALDLPPLRARTITFSAFGLPADYTFHNGWLTAHGQPVLEQTRTFLSGPHNAENQLAALAIADLFAVDRFAAIEALCAYRPLPHRCELVRELDGVRYINDSKGTNIDALEKALLAQPHPIILIAGGKDKGVDFAPLKPLLSQKVTAAILIGEMQSALLRAWGQTIPCHRALDLPDAVAQARSLARPGSTVLLSPGCSSYDMFKNFEERGNLFRQLVIDLT